MSRCVVVQVKPILVVFYSTSFSVYAGSDDVQHYIGLGFPQYCRLHNIADTAFHGFVTLNGWKDRRMPAQWRRLVVFRGKQKMPVNRGMYIDKWTNRTVWIVKRLLKVDLHQVVGCSVVTHDQTSFRPVPKHDPRFACFMPPALGLQLVGGQAPQPLHVHYLVFNPTAWSNVSYAHTALWTPQCWKFTPQFPPLIYVNSYHY